MRTGGNDVYRDQGTLAVTIREEANTQDTNNDGQNSREECEECEECLE